MSVRRDAERKRTGDGWSKLTEEDMAVTRMSRTSGSEKDTNASLI